MGAPPPDVGYTSATTWRGDHEVHKGYVVAFGKKERKKGCAIEILPRTMTSDYFDRN
jgi:hypothetical protein